MRKLSHSLLIFLALLGTLGTQARAASAAQLQASTDQVAALLNGEAARLRNPPRLIAGRTMLPLREVAGLLGQVIRENGSQWQLGRLSIDSAAPSVRLGDVNQPDGSVAYQGDVLYIGARLLADGLGANLSFSDDARNLSLTALPAGGDPLSPQARFSTDKNVYAPGEKVVYTEYAFDPDGADIVSRKWSGRQDVYFQPGRYTVGLQVTNARGLVSTPYSRVLNVVGQPIDTPISYALKYAEPGESFPDAGVNTYPLVRAVAVPAPAMPLLVSNSPEAPNRSGVLYQDSVSGKARLLAYHLNTLSKPARLYVVARNLEAKTTDVITERSGETAPTRIESVLGQVTLLDYFAGSENRRVSVAPGESVAVYASPTLSPGSGVNLLQDINTTGRVELTFALIEDGLPPTSAVLRQLPYLVSDARHVRGTFQGAVKIIRAQLRSLPARLVIGDGQIDPALVGIDATNGRLVRLSGNYGVLYDIQITGATGAAVALSPRGGLYRGAMNVGDGPIQQTVKLPRSGSALTPDAPTMLWRAETDQLNIGFVPASGSNLPISLVFYQTRVPGAFGGTIKTYTP
ncbi:copper amine oxidase N-terminal domain-containing protein [Deinococcus sp.]|uniref:copper amine oxidase N-terminal domain-containing protein n=1 Tax=Deinococcus sp. TaxID=47478 RepID=UPI0025D610E2|nr:copper amine oxidase N-terminal domain-containing protein [Deinococcus sp.]